MQNAPISCSINNRGTRFCGQMETAVHNPATVQLKVEEKEKRGKRGVSSDEELIVIVFSPSDCMPFLKKNEFIKYSH